MQPFSFRLAIIAVALILMGGCPWDSSTVYVNRDTSPDPEPIATGPQTVMSAGFEREYYVQLPSDYDDGSGAAPAAIGDDDRKPLVIAYHGYTGSYEAWLGENRFYDLADVIGDDAIIVAANGLPDLNGVRSWGAEADFEFFLDLIAELDLRGLQYNPNKVFLAGHSNGAGHAHELGCRYGDVVRAIAVAAGSLTSTECVGSAAILIMQGSNDPLTQGILAGNSVSYWALYNGWDTDAFVPSELGPCDDFSFPGEANSPYPVLFCEHVQGHSWPDFGSQTAWDLMTGLPEVEPTADYPAGGGSERAKPPSDTTLTFRMDVPDDINRPLNAAATLRPVGFIDNPTCSAPAVILNVRFSVDGLLVPGQISDPITIPITYFTFSGGVEFPSEWALSITIYVEGGNDGSIPSPFVDHDTVIPVMLTDNSTPLVFDDPLPLSPVGDLCGILD